MSGVCLKIQESVEFLDKFADVVTHGVSKERKSCGGACQVFY